MAADPDDLLLFPCTLHLAKVPGNLDRAQRVVGQIMAALAFSAAPTGRQRLPSLDIVNRSNLVLLDSVARLPVGVRTGRGKGSGGSAGAEVGSTGIISSSSPYRTAAGSIPSSRSAYCRLQPNPGTWSQMVNQSPLLLSLNKDRKYGTVTCCDQLATIQRPLGHQNPYLQRRCSSRN